MPFDGYSLAPFSGTLVGRNWSKMVETPGDSLYGEFLDLQMVTKTRQKRLFYATKKRTQNDYFAQIENRIIELIIRLNR